MRKKKGWSNYNHLQSKRHSNAKKYGKAGGLYASSKPTKRIKPVSMSAEAGMKTPAGLEGTGIKTYSKPVSNLKSKEEMIRIMGSHSKEITKGMSNWKTEDVREIYDEFEQVKAEKMVEAVIRNQKAEEIKQAELIDEREKDLPKGYYDEPEYSIYALKNGRWVEVPNTKFYNQSEAENRVKELGGTLFNKKLSVRKKAKKKVKPLSDRQKQNRFYEDYVLDSISNEGDDDAKPLKTPKEKLQYLKDTFRKEYWDNNPSVQRLGEQKAFEQYIRGLPSSYNIEFYNYKILELAKKSGSLPKNATEKQEDRVIENYWNFMANKTFQAFRKYDVK